MPAAAADCAARCRRRVAAIVTPLPSATTAAIPRLRIACSIIHASGSSSAACAPRRPDAAGRAGIAANHDASSNRRSGPFLAAGIASIPPPRSSRRMQARSRVRKNDDA